MYSRTRCSEAEVAPRPNMLPNMRPCYIPLIGNPVNCQPQPRPRKKKIVGLVDLRVPSLTQFTLFTPLFGQRSQQQPAVRAQLDSQTR